MTELQPVALFGVGAALPSLRLAVSEVTKAWGGAAGKGRLAICDSDEDTLTLAWQAASDATARAGVSPSDVSSLWWATTRPPFAEGPSFAFLSAALGLEGSCEGALISGSTHAGMEALCAAWDAVASRHAAVALVVASDALVPGMGTSAETATGAGAVAFVLAPPATRQHAGSAQANGAAPPAMLVSRSTRSMPVVDRYRGPDQQATADTYDARLFREEVFLPLVTAAGKSLSPGDGTRWSISDPDGKLASSVARKLGGELASAGLFESIGDTGAPASLLGSLLAMNGPADVGLIGYGGGRATAIGIRVSRAVPGADELASQLDVGRAVTYTDALKVRSQLEPMLDPIPMGVPPAGAAFVRGNVEMLSLQGARCNRCGFVSTPPSIHPTCVGCASADLELISLSRRGRVETFVVNQTMPPPFQAPLPIVVVDLEDGARLMVHGSPADASTIAVGDAIVLKLRLYARERSVPVYGYKAFVSHQAPGERAAAGASAPAAGASASGQPAGR